jgi:hypothetical protein
MNILSSKIVTVNTFGRQQTEQSSVNTCFVPASGSMNTSFSSPQEAQTNVANPSMEENSEPFFYSQEGTTDISKPSKYRVSP